jgi:hypothetical protein
MIFNFCHLVHFLYSLGLEFVAPSVDNMCRIFSCRKHVKLHIKTCLFIFYIYSFLQKYLYMITYACETSPPPCKWSYFELSNIFTEIYSIKIIYLENRKNKVFESCVHSTCLLFSNEKILHCWNSKHLN